MDLRSLSLMRIGIACIVIADLIIRGTDISAMYTDEGWWPRRVVEMFGFKTGYWSLHLISGSYAWQLALFSLQFMFALFLLFGLHTRTASLLLWLLYISLHNRNLYINQSGDDLLRLILFWGIFLPWQAHYSFDAGKRRYTTLLTANLGYLILIASVYIFTAALKSGKEWTSDHTAVYYALSLEQLKLPFIADLIYPHPELMKFLTVWVYVVEAILPLFILFPSKKGYFRMAAFFLLLQLHIGIGCTLYVGLFFIINIVTSIGLLSDKAMNRLERFIPAWMKKKKTGKWSFDHVHYRPWVRLSAFWLGLVIILAGFAQNLSTLRFIDYEPVDAVTTGLNACRFNQNWGMFSPNILKRDGWYVHYGMDSIGRQWDMIRNEDYVSFEKPKSILAIHKNDRWRKLTENMQREDMYFLRPLYCRYLLRNWNQHHPEKQLHSLTLYYLKKETLPNYQFTPVERQVYCVCDNS